MKNKILFILHLPPPVHGSAMVGQYIKDSKIVKNAFDAKFINLSTSLTIDEIGKNPMVKFSRYFKIIFEFILCLIKFKPQTVYLAITAKGVGFYKDFFIVLLAKLFGVRLVLHFHNKGVQLNSHIKLDDFLYRFTFKNTKVILLTKYLYSDIEKYASKENVFYCPNGIPDISAMENVKPKEDKPVQILFLSNLIVSKGVFVLLEACKILLDKNIGFRCNFVGGEGDISKTDFNNYAMSLGIENYVKYLGGKYNQEKSDIFFESNIFVHPTFEDCFPLVLLEALQYSLPIVSTFEGGIPDIVEDNINGFLVKEKDVIALAEKLEILILKPEVREKMGIASRVKFEKEYILDKFENNLTNILKKNLK